MLTQAVFLDSANGKDNLGQVETTELFFHQFGRMTHILDIESFTVIPVQSGHSKDN